MGEVADICATAVRWGNYGVGSREAINLGYQQYSGLVLEKLNGKEIHSLADLAAVLDEAKEGNLVFEFMDDPGKLVLDAAEVRAKQDEIGKAYGISELRKL